MVNSPVRVAPDERNIQLVKDRERLTKLLESIRRRIIEIKDEYPYTMKLLLQSPEKTKARKTELSASIEQLREVLAAYESKIEKMLR